MESLLNIKTCSKHTLIKVNPLTLIILILSLYFGRFNYIFIHYCIALFHELCHILTAKIFKVKVSSISFLPFGFYAKIDDLEKVDPFKQLLIIIMGPLSFFVIWLLIYILKFNFIISPYTYNYAFSSALTIMLFNLIPLYPLDGARAFEIFVAFKFDEYNTRVIRVLMSFISLLFLTFYCIKNSQYIVLIFLILSVLYEIVFFKKNYMIFLLKRMYEKNSKTLKIVRDYKIYRYRRCKLIKEDKIVEESGIIKNILAKYNNKNNL